MHLIPAVQAINKGYTSVSIVVAKPAQQAKQCGDLISPPKNFCKIRE
jgi:hypothetical protein